MEHNFKFRTKQTNKLKENELTQVTSPCNVETLTHLFVYSKIGDYMGNHYLLIFSPKHKLWVLVRTA